jgi:hypothetical protein
MLSFERKIAIDGDARDYYSYLVSLFIDHNFTHQIGNDWYLINTPTGTINVHTIGASILIAPFFFGAFLFSKIFGFQLDGFSTPFQVGVYLAGIFYCILGLVFLKKLLLQLNFKKEIVASLLILTCFGTHLFSYTVNEPGMPHVYSFALTSAFFYFSLNLFQTRKANYYYLGAIVLGLIILVRPVNVILLIFVPFFFQNRYDLMSNLKVIVRSKHFYLSLFVLLLVCSIQSVAWYSQNGKLLQDSYAGNGFYFNDPKLFKMLFGFNNGLFVYVPLCFLFLFGIISIFIDNKFKGFVFVFSVAFFLFIFSSYWAYNYFDGFGIRTIVDFLPIFIISGAYMLQSFPAKLKYAAFGFSFLSLLLNLIYIYQYRNGIIKGNGMNFVKYSYVFMKTNKAYADSLGGANDLPLYSKTNGKLVFENYEEKTIGFKDLDTSIVFNYAIPTQSANGFYTLIEFERKEDRSNSSFNGFMVLDALDPKGLNKSHQTFRLNEIPSRSCCDWKKYSYSIACTGKFSKDDELSLIILNPDKASFYIKNFKVKIYDYSYTI